MGGGQYGEDRILNLFFKQQEEGLLIDVGAADGFWNSNSLMLLRKPGWKGILIEPEPSQFKVLQDRYKDRPGVTCVECAIGPDEGPRTLFCSGQVSTLRKEAKEAAEEMHDVKFTEARVEVRNLTRLLSELRVEEPIDFISIDTEGTNYETWQTLDTRLFFPKLVCIEGKGYAMYGYKEFCRTVGNTFYLREDLCDPL